MITPERILVALHTHDPIYRAGVSSLLRHRPEVTLLDTAAPAADAQVALVVVDTVEEPVLRLLRETKRAGSARSVLVVADIDGPRLADAAECGVKGVVRRAQATPDRLVHAITTVARGDGYLPDDLIGGVLGAFGTLRERLPGPVEQRLTELDDRELEVLRLLAEGLDTNAIAAKVGYAERTVKNFIHVMQTRLGRRTGPIWWPSATSADFFDRALKTSNLFPATGVARVQPARFTSPRQHRNAGGMAGELLPPPHRRRMPHVRERLHRR
ncbi:response regulator transcription factor [Streptomyces vietnamensis]|uniref:response regulator transcription factor n=1 Tax=Streptomyces vietnamensis TaxID=362257 RepID=UPI003441E012